VLFAISKDVINQHKAMANADKFRLTYNFINPEPILKVGSSHAASGERALPFAPHQPVIGLVGRITPYKQPDLFVRAVPHILKEVPEARFVLVGAAQEREKPYEESIRELAIELGVHEQVAFLGLRRDAVALTSEFTIACLTSGREPLGRVILEANLLGVPVVVPESGGPAEIVLPEETGLHFASTAPDAELHLSRQIVRLLKDPSLRACLAARGKEHVLSTFASHHPVQVQEDCIDELCSLSSTRK
jgi:glycosyltransferase involved in cell wall biosynthesis